MGAGTDDPRARGSRRGSLHCSRRPRALQAENPEGEAFIRRHFRDRWLRRESTARGRGVYRDFSVLGGDSRALPQALRRRRRPRTSGPRDQAAPRRRRRVSRFGVALSRQRGGPVRGSVRTLSVGDARGQHGRLPAHRLSDRSGRSPRRLQPRAAPFPDHRVSRGFTTFSAYGYETYFLVRVGETALAAANACGQVVLGLAAVWAGHLIANLLPR